MKKPDGAMLAVAQMVGVAVLGVVAFATFGAPVALALPIKPLVTGAALGLLLALPKKKGTD